MTFTNQTNRVSAVGNAAVGQAVPFSFPISVSSDLTVIQRVTATGVETTLAETTNYTVAITGDTGGTVTTVTAVAATAEIHVIRDTPNTQELDLEQGGTFNAENVEDALDKNTKLGIENKDAITRTLRAPATDATSLDMELPDSVTRAEGYMYFDASGEPTVVTGVTPDDVVVSAYGETLVDDANAAAAQTTLLLKDGSAALVTASEQTDSLVTKSPWFDVTHTDYGATGDGSTDDTAAIQAALDAALTAAGSSGTGYVYFPAGEYKLVTNALTWSPANSDVELFIKGDGRGTQIIQSTTNVNAMTIGNAGQGCKVHICDIGFGCVAGTGAALELLGMTRSYFNNVHIPGGGDYGIHVKKGWINTLTNIICSTQGTPDPKNVVGAPTTAWIYLDADSSSINDFRFYGLTIENGTGTGLKVDDSGKNISVFGGVIEGITTPVEFDGIDEIIFDNVYMESTDGPSTITACKGGRVQLDGDGEWTFDDCDSMLITGKSSWSADDELLTINSNCRAMRIAEYQINGGRFGNLRNNALDTEVGFVTDGGDTYAADDAEFGPGIITRNYPVLQGGTDRWLDATTLGPPWGEMSVPTIAREAVITWANHDYSIKVTTDGDDGIFYAIPAYFQDQWVSVEVWAYVASGDFALQISTTARTVAKCEVTGAWFKRTLSIWADGTQVNVRIRSNGAASVFYVGAVNIWAESGPGFAQGPSDGIVLLSRTTLDVQAAAQTTLFVVPAGVRCILDHIKIVAGATASPTAVVSFGQQGAATDFLGNQTMTNLAAQYDTVICAPVPNATPVKTKSYAAATIIEADVTTADVDGGTDNTVYLYGTLY
jgi:hypothetical protein